MTSTPDPDAGSKQPEQPQTVDETAAPEAEATAATAPEEPSAGEDAEASVVHREPTGEGDPGADPLDDRRGRGVDGGRRRRWCEEDEEGGKEVEHRVIAASRTREVDDTPVLPSDILSART